jgi:adenylate cyclase
LASVFLSYSREDLVRAEALAAALEGLGHSVWWDRRIHGGSRFSQEIEKALKTADAVVVLWSHASIESAWVQDEAAEGRDSGRLVPVIMDDCKPPLGFRQYQAVDLSGWNGRGKSAAVAAVADAVLARTGSPLVSGSEHSTPARKRPLPHRKLAVSAGGILAILAIGLVYLFAFPKAQAHGVLRLQLAQFEPLSPAVPRVVPQTLREEILSALATDAVILASADQPPAGTQLGYALTGTVGQSEGNLRFNLHLVDTATGATVWTATLERPVSASELAPRQVAVGINAVLRCGLGGAARYRKQLPDNVLSLYMNFCEEYRSTALGRQADVTRGLDMARRVVAEAPDFSNGWSGLAMIARIAAQANALLDKQALQQEAQAAANRALSLDPQNSEAYQALALVQPPFAFAARERLHVKSVSVRPGDCGCEFVSYAGFLSRVGREEQALNAYQRAHDMMPLAADIGTSLAESEFVNGHTREGMQVVADVRKLWPDTTDVEMVLLRTAFWTGKYDDAATALADPDLRISDEARRALSLALTAVRNGAGGDRAAAVAALLKIQPDATEAPLVITALAALGARAEALNTAAKVIPSNLYALPLLFEPPLAPARGSPEFAQIAQRFGLISYWRQTGHRPDFCNSASAPPLCARL